MPGIFVIQYFEIRVGHGQFTAIDANLAVDRKIHSRGQELSHIGHIEPAQIEPRPVRVIHSSGSDLKITLVREPPPRAVDVYAYADGIAILQQVNRLGVPPVFISAGNAPQKLLHGLHPGRLQCLQLALSDTRKPLQSGIRLQCCTHQRLDLPWFMQR